MDGESLLYIIIAIIYLVVSALNSNKKKKEAQKRKQAQPEGQPKQGSTLEDIFREMMEPETAEEVEEIPEPVQPTRESMEREWRSPAEIQAEIEEKQRQAQLELERQRRLTAIQESIERKKAIAMERRESMNKKLASHKKEVRITSSKKSAASSKINLRQAIIGKIILERPYE